MGVEQVVWRRLLSRQRNFLTVSFSFVQNSNSRKNCKRHYSSESDDSKPGKSSKQKLHDLLNSIVQESQERTRRNKVSAVDYKLAVPKREKRIKAEGKSEEAEIKGEESVRISPELLSAVKSVAADLKGDSNIIENELVQKLKTQQTEKINLSELFLGMKIDRTSNQQPNVERSAEFEVSRAQRVRRMLNEDGGRQHFDRRQVDQQQRPARSSQTYTYMPIDIFGSKPLGIFTAGKRALPPDIPTLTTWDRIHEKELKLGATHPPANGFEEMILWTEQGKLWHFPIDNEQGIEEERKYDFTDHVFLEPVIETWCPKKGPVRHFMELVTVALSKNPYLTVPEKHEYLHWYHEYFKGKSNILEEVGAGAVH